MSKTSITGCTGRTVPKLHRVWYRHAIKALVGVSGACALIGVGLLAVPWSDAAAAKQAGHKAKAAAVECSTFGHTGIPGVVINETGTHLKRTFVEHGPGTGFFKPEPPAEVPANTISPWCVGSHFGVEAMQVDYVTPNGERVHFLAYYASLTPTGGLNASCSISGVSQSRAVYGCAAERVGPNFVCTPYVGCVGPLKDKNALKGVDVVFRVFPR